MLVISLPDGEQVLAEEHYFLVRAPEHVPSREHWTTEEHEMMADHRWWSVEEPAATSDVVYPEDLVAILDRARDPFERVSLAPNTVWAPV